VITVFGHPISVCTRKVLVALHEIGVPFEMQIIDFIGKREHKQPAHLARQPFGKMPAIDDQGFALYESRAIIRYLNDRYDGDLVPTEVLDRATMDQWISVEYSYFSAAATKPILHHLSNAPYEDAELVAADATVDQTLDALETRLAAHPYLAGDQFSLAEIVYLPYLDYLMFTPKKAAISSHPHVATWLTRNLKRPSWQETTKA
jgi:glutathione S-transferase